MDELQKQVKLYAAKMLRVNHYELILVREGISKTKWTILQAACTDNALNHRRFHAPGQTYNVTTHRINEGSRVARVIDNGETYFYVPKV